MAAEGFTGVPVFQVRWKHHTSGCGTSSQHHIFCTHWLVCWQAHSTVLAAHRHRPFQLGGSPC